MICIKYDHAFAKDMKRKFIEGSKASFASASVTSEPSSSHNKSTGSSTPASAASNAPVLLENKPVPRNRNPFAEESEEDENEDDSEFELDASLPKVPSDRKLRPRASRVIAIED